MNYASYTVIGLLSIGIRAVHYTVCVKHSKVQSFERSFFFHCTYIAGSECFHVYTWCGMPTAISEETPTKTG